MAFNNTPTPDLSRFSIGEIVDLAGVPDFYNAGSSKWLRSGVATASSNLTATTRTNLANAGTAASPTVLTQSALSLSYNGFGFTATYPIQRISASSVSVVPATYNNTTTVGVGVMTAAGLQAVSTGQTSIVQNDPSYGQNVFVASNNTKIFSYCFTSATALNVRSTTNGTTWTAETVTGLPTFATDGTTYASATASQNATYVVAGTIGWKRTGEVGYTSFCVFWCGARFLLLAPGATNFVASLSTDGFTFGGDNTTAVIGATARAKSSSVQFYRNGNNCYLSVATAHRFSTDGGVTWSASTFAAAPNASEFYLQYNQSDPAKLVILPGTNQTTAYYTADSGATWSASRTLPTDGQNGGLYYKGTTLVISNGSTQYYVSTNDGVTWTVPTFPIGVLSTNLRFFADANRFYAGVASQPQLLTSSDAVTWTIVTLAQNFSLGTLLTNAGYGILPFDSNTVVLLGYNSAIGANQCFFTTDGGVTWTGSQYTSSNTGGNWNVGNAFVTPDAGGVGFAFGAAGVTSANCTNVLKADITAGGAFYRTGSTAITPIRTGSLAYVRVG
jgi:hypothetical protein